MRESILNVRAYLYWRFRRGHRSDAVRILRFLRKRPGSSTHAVSSHLWSCLPTESVAKFCEHVEPELQRLHQYGIIECHDGWHPSSRKNPFAFLPESFPDDESLLSAFGDLALSFSRTNHRQFARELALFVNDDVRDITMRKFAYIHLLDVVGIPVEQWPNIHSLAIPAGLDWPMLDSYLARAV